MDVEQFCKYLLGISVSSFGSYLFSPLVHLLTRRFMLNFCSSLYMVSIYSWRYSYQRLLSIHFFTLFFSVKQFFFLILCNLLCQSLESISVLKVIFKEFMPLLILNHHPYACLQQFWHGWLCKVLYLQRIYFQNAG